MGRSQGLKRVKEKGDSSAINVARTILLVDGNRYRLRGIGLGGNQMIFSSPEMLIELIQTGDMDKFWQEVLNQDIEPIGAGAKGVRRLFKDPVFKAFYNKEISKSERELAGFNRPEYHWMTSYGFDDRERADEFKEEFAQAFSEGLIDPSRKIISIEDVLFDSELIGDYELANYFRLKLNHMSAGDKTVFDNYVFDEVMPLVSRHPENYVSSEMVKSLASQIGDANSSEQVIEDPLECHEYLKQALGSSDKFGQSYYYYSCPWTRRGVSIGISRKINAIWQAKGNIERGDVADIGFKESCHAFSKQLATVITRDYRNKTENQDADQKIRHGMQKVKNTKTVFRRLKPIFESGGKLDDFNKIIKDKKLDSVTEQQIINMVEEVSIEFVSQYKPSSAGFVPGSVSLASILADKIQKMV